MTPPNFNFLPCVLDMTVCDSQHLIRAGSCHPWPAVRFFHMSLSPWRWLVTLCPAFNSVIQPVRFPANHSAAAIANLKDPLPYHSAAAMKKTSMLVHFLSLLGAELKKDRWSIIKIGNLWMGNQSSNPCNWFKIVMEADVSCIPFSNINYSDSHYVFTPDS